MRSCTDRTGCTPRRDLLAAVQPKSPLEVREAPGAGVCVPAAIHAEVRDWRDVFALVDAGGRNRAVRATDFNAHSSRSHAVLQLWVEQRTMAADVSQQHAQAQQELGLDQPGAAARGRARAVPAALRAAAGRQASPRLPREPLAAQAVPPAAGASAAPPPAAAQARWGGAAARPLCGPS